MVAGRAPAHRLVRSVVAQRAPFEPQTRTAPPARYAPVLESAQAVRLAAEIGPRAAETLRRRGPCAGAPSATRRESDA